MSDKSTLVLDIRGLEVKLSDNFGVIVERLGVRRGEVVVLDAPSGAGKSTVLGLISGAISAEPREDTRHNVLQTSVFGTVPSPDKMGFVLQSSTLVPYLNIAENISLPCRVAQLRIDTEWLAFLIRGLGLQGLENRKPAQVSLGQRQRAGIARAFLSRPAVLLLDEPVSALDPANVDQVERLIAFLSEDAQTAVVLASHQAQRGAFAHMQRAHHRTETRGNCLYSVFEMEAAA